jgi:hypothetical protein
MIVGSFDQIAPETAHDHGFLGPAPAGMALCPQAKMALAGAAGRGSVGVSLLSVVGEGVEVLRSAIPRLCLVGARETSG